MSESDFPVNTINRLIAVMKYASYLEIGVQHKNTFNAVVVGQKHCVDPDPQWGADFVMPSDEFFVRGLGLPLYDCIYVDGDHRELPALRDMCRAVERLSPRGTVFCDNLLPYADWQESLRESGRAWRAWAYMRMSRPDLWMTVLDVPFGLGVIRRGRQELFTPPECPYHTFQHDPSVDWFFYIKYRNALMNVVSLDDFWKVAAAWPQEQGGS